jgi:hypothetical protein
VKMVQMLIFQVVHSQRNTIYQVLSQKMESESNVMNNDKNRIHQCPSVVNLIRISMIEGVRMMRNSNHQVFQ